MTTRNAALENAADPWDDYFMRTRGVTAAQSRLDDEANYRAFNAPLSYEFWKRQLCEIRGHIWRGRACTREERAAQIREDHIGSCYWYV